MVHIVSLLGYIVGVAAVCFIEFLLLFKILKSYVERKNLKYEIKIAKDAAVLAVAFGIISLIVPAQLMGQISIVIILLAALLWATTLF